MAIVARPGLKDNVGVSEFRVRIPPEQSYKLEFQCLIFMVYDSGRMSVESLDTYIRVQVGPT